MLSVLCRACFLLLAIAFFMYVERRKKSTTCNPCLHTKVLLHGVAQAQGVLKKGVWSSDPYVKGADGRVRATKAAQVLALVSVPSDEHYYKKETMEKMAAKRKEREDEATRRKEVIDAKKRQREERDAERRRIVELADARRANVEARNKAGKYCVCDRGEGDERMVTCSRCRDWFHFSCVNYDESKLESKGKRWYCDVCDAAVQRKANSSN